MLKNQSIVRFLIFILCFAFVQTNFGWNKPGHMTVAAIAYFKLKEKNNAALNKVLYLLRKHQSFSSWQSKINNQHIGNSDEDIFLMMYGGRWSDDVRGTSEDRESWHFIDYPFKPDGQPNSVKTYPPPSENLEKAWNENAAILRDTNQPDAVRAKALGWLLHLGGDAHQPLHTVTLFTTIFNTQIGDRGGTRFYIRTEEKAETISLHKFWDGAVIGSERFSTVKNLATRLKIKYPRSTFSQVNESEIDKWVMESFALAKSNAYLDGKLKGSKNENDGSLLIGDYAKDSGVLAEKRVVLAGYRLADFLSNLF